MDSRQVVFIELCARIRDERSLDSVLLLEHHVPLIYETVRSLCYFLSHQLL